MRIRSLLPRISRTVLAVLCVVVLLIPPIAAPAAPDLSADGFAVFTDPVSANGIALYPSGSGDSQYTLTTVQGKPVITTEKYAYFTVSNAALRAADAVTVTITLLDTGSTPLYLQYCSTENPYTTMHVYGSGSGDFITVEIPLYDTDLAAAAQNAGASFRFWGGTVHSIFLKEGADEDATVTFTNPITSTGGVMAFPSSDGKANDSCYALETVDGVPVARLEEQYIYFRVSNPRLKAATELTLTVTFLDEGSTPILFQYCSTKSAYELLHIQRYNTGKTVTAEIPLTNTALGDAAQNFGASFRFQRGTFVSLKLTTDFVDHTEDINQTPPVFAPQTELNNIIGKGIAGYQVWFRANESTTGGWPHWAQNGIYPTAGNVHPDIYPYTDDYLTNGAPLYQSGLANLGNGNPSLLFNSPDEEIIKTHMQWMQEYDIDGAAVQRFYSATNPMRSDRKNTMMTIREQAEAYGRIFYVMYDFSYASRNDPETFIRTVKLDFIYNMEETGIVSSPNYGHADGKPVVCLWGLVGDPATEYFCGETATHLIEWFKARGYYVIGGCPDNEYDKADEEYLEPFTKLDMLSLWTVGRYNTASMQHWYDIHIPIDLAFCEKYGIDYQPVIWSGFGWCNMKNSGRPNSHPRLAGDFLWDQAYILKNEYDIDTVYFAMWDEYDESTAIMKAATDYFEIPTDQYFLTYATDGWWLSNDFYLRTADAALDMMQGEAPLRADIDVPHSLGPVYWRNSFESREATYTLDGGNTILSSVERLDVCLNNPQWLDHSALALPQTVITADYAHSGASAFRFAATARSGYRAVYRIAETAITASQPLELSYYLYAADENGRDVYVDLLFSDGTRLSQTNVAATATHGQSGEWVQVTLPLGPAADGKTIVGVAVGYHGAVGAFDAYIDDILLEHSSDPHRWDAGLVLEKATALQPGVREHACQNDGCTATVQEWYAHDPATCDHSDAERRTGVTPTCTESGITAGIWCFTCNAYAEGGEPLPPHDIESRGKIPPAVGKVGYTAGVWCLVCEKYIQGGEEIPALHPWGDVDHNGRVDSTDARLTLQFAVQKISETALDLTAADVDGNGRVDSTDARLILQYAVQKIASFPVE